jgi:hypothetical protein
MANSSGNWGEIFFRLSRLSVCIQMLSQSMADRAVMLDCIACWRDLDSASSEQGISVLEGPVGVGSSAGYVVPLSLSGVLW